MTSAILVADTSVLLNFLKIGRMDLIGSHPRRFLATDHVENEIIDETQRAAFLAAVASGHLDTCTVNDPREVELFFAWHPAFAWVPGNVRRLPLQ